MSAREIASKCRSKPECYDFCTVGMEYYLPGYNNLTIYFLKDLMSKKKTRKYPRASYATDICAAIKATAI